MSKLPPDPVIDEIREIRHRISERCGHDPKRLYEYYVKRQEDFKEWRVLESKDAHSASSKTHGV